MPADHEPDPPIFLKLCVECREYVSEWLPFPNGPVCWACIERGEEDDTPLFTQELGGES